MQRVDTDVAALGSGAAGLVAAFAAAEAGTRFTLLEKGERVGGTTALSGGTTWIPANPHQAAAGVEDSRDDALAYLGSLAHGMVDPRLAEAFVDTGPELVRWLEATTPVRFHLVPGLPDYHPERPGGKPRGSGTTVAFTCFPHVIDGLMAQPGFAEAFARVRLMLNVAPPDTLRTIQARAPHTVQLTSYGSSEMSGIAATTHPHDPDDVRLGTNGHPLPGMEMAVMDLVDDVLLPPGERGEIVVRGVGMFTGYWNELQNPRTADGWFRSGDHGFVDADGRVHYHGRLKDMIKVGGENVAALEVESVLAQHPDVAVVAVVAAPDPRYTEVPAAFVELREGAATSAEELQLHCAAALARFKVPRHVRFVREWPMSATKIQKEPLRRRLADELAVRNEAKEPV